MTCILSNQKIKINENAMIGYSAGNPAEYKKVTQVIEIIYEILFGSLNSLPV